MDATNFRNYAADADQHGNRMVPISTETLRRVADELDRMRYALARLGSSNTMTAPLALDPLRDAELIARMKFADAAARGDQ